MGFNPKNPKDIGRLRQSATLAQRQWGHFLSRRAEALREMAGNNYGEKNSGTPDSMLYPMLGLYVKTISRLITSDNPKCHFHHWNPDTTAHCKDLEIMVNDEFERIDLAGSLSATVTASMFGLGVCKIGRVLKGATEEEGGYLHEVGGLFVDPVLDEDFIFDMRAKRWEGVAFMGDISRVPLEWAKSNKAFFKTAREKLSATHRLNDLPLAGSAREIHSQLLPSYRSTPLEDEYEDMVDVWNLWMPNEQLMLVIDREFSNILSIEEWEGPRHGPYHILGYNWLPGNLVPVSPVSELMDIHRATNIIVNKVGDQIANMKTVIAVDGATGAKDGNTIKDAKNRGIVEVGSTASIKPITFNGPDGQLWTLANALLDKFSYFTGNIEALAGLGPQSATIGQDRLLAESANRQVTDMQGEVMKFTSKIMTDLAWYVKTDPDWSRQLVKEVPYADMKIPFVGRPSDIPGEKDDYKLAVEPYTLATKTPSQRMMMLRQMINETVLPMMPMMQAQGQSIDMEKFLKKVAEYADLPELANIIIYSEGEAEPAAGAGEDASTKSPVTTRNYVRENRSTATRKGTNAAQVAASMQAPRGGSSQAVGEMVTVG